MENSGLQTRRNDRRRHKIDWDKGVANLADSRSSRTGATIHQDKGKVEGGTKENPLQGRHLGEEGGKLARALIEGEWLELSVQYPFQCRDSVDLLGCFYNELNLNCFYSMFHARKLGVIHVPLLDGSFCAVKFTLGIILRYSLLIVFDRK